jgi:hypothetical protein
MADIAREFKGFNIILQLNWNLTTPDIIWQDNAHGFTDGIACRTTSDLPEVSCGDGKHNCRRTGRSHSSLIARSLETPLPYFCQGGAKGQTASGEEAPAEARIRQ